MKNSEIHNGLPNQEIRDFLAKSLVKSFDELCELNEKNNKYKPSPKTNNSYDSVVFAINKDIEALKNKLEIAKIEQAIFALILNNGWKEFDVSDETIKDLSYQLKLSFIGTEDEYNELIKKIKLENE